MEVLLNYLVEFLLSSLNFTMFPFRFLMEIDINYLIGQKRIIRQIFDGFPHHGFNLLFHNKRIFIEVMSNNLKKFRYH